MSNHVTEWLNAYFDGELTGRKLHQVEEHLAPRRLLRLRERERDDASLVRAGAEDSAVVEKRERGDAVHAERAGEIDREGSVIGTESQKEPGRPGRAGHEERAAGPAPDPEP